MYIVSLENLEHKRLTITVRGIKDVVQKRPSHILFSKLFKRRRAYPEGNDGGQWGSSRTTPRRDPRLSRQYSEPRSLEGKRTSGLLNGT